MQTSSGVQMVDGTGQRYGCSKANKVALDKRPAREQRTRRIGVELSRLKWMRVIRYTVSLTLFSSLTRAKSYVDISLMAGTRKRVKWM